MSEVRVNNIVDFGGKGAPTFDNGAVISGVSSLGNQAKIGGNVTITSGGINVSGVTTAATLSGNLTGDVNAGFLTATSTVIGSGVTINAGGLNITGVVTATSFTGDGSTMTGVAMSISPLAYNPDVNDGIVTTGTGIGITFDHRILAGSGNVTLSIATNAGAAGTTVENFGVGSSVTIAGRKASISPSNALTYGETYHISYPSGAFTNTSGDVSYVGTAYTFGTKSLAVQLWAWGGDQDMGELGLNNRTKYSSPIQIPGTTWSSFRGDADGLMDVGRENSQFNKTDGTLWAWGLNNSGQLGQNSRTYYSSPVQIPGTTWTGKVSGRGQSAAIKTDGTLWAWGRNDYGQCVQNNTTPGYSSPVQIGSDTNWDYVNGKNMGCLATKTDGTLWFWGQNEFGQYGNPSIAHGVSRSSPTQVPGDYSNHKGFSIGGNNTGVIKSDSTLWVMGQNNNGQLGQNGPVNTHRSSPTQIPGTTWKAVTFINSGACALAVKTDGTLWAWGDNTNGNLGVPSLAETAKRSSPIQVGSDTTWDKVGATGRSAAAAIKTDGTLWTWGQNNKGQLGLNDKVLRSSPTQVPGTWHGISGTYSGFSDSVMALRSI